MENSTPTSGNNPLSPSGNTGSTSSIGAVQRGVDTAGSALHSTIDKVADPARNTVERVATAAHETVDKLASNAAHVADRFTDQAHWVSEAPGRVLEGSRSWVQEKPLEAVAAALALGFILGRLTAR
ncbi:MAG: hypothetical protein ABIR56_12625 [Polaromonas sp.]